MRYYYDINFFQFLLYNRKPTFKIAGIITIAAVKTIVIRLSSFALAPASMHLYICCKLIDED